MSRIKPVDPATATGKVKEIFSGPLEGKHFNIYKSIASSPAALSGYLAFSKSLGEGMLSKKEIEVIQLAVGEANGCEYCTAAHTMVGKMAGLSEDQIKQARRGTVPGDAKLDAVARFATALHEKKGYVGEGDLKKFREAGFTDGHATEVIANYALATFTNYFNHVNETPLDFPAAPKLG